MFLKLISILFLLFCFTLSSAQQATKLSIDSTRVDAKLIIGFWESADSNKYQLEFTDEVWAVKLPSAVGVAGGYFFSKDSLGMMLLKGWAPNWPPYDCELYFISTDTLEVSTWCFMCDPIKSIFVRVK